MLTFTWKCHSGSTFNVVRVHDVVVHELEVRVSNPVLNVATSAREEVVQRYHFVSVHHELIHEVRTHEARASGDKYPLPSLLVAKFDLRERTLLSKIYFAHSFIRNFTFQRPDLAPFGDAGAVPPPEGRITGVATGWFLR